MRAPVQKKWPRGKGGARPGNGGAGQAEAPTPRPARTARVRNRLIIAVAVVAAAVAGAGVPAVVAASSQANDTQSLVTLGELTQQSVTLGQSLADERDEVTAYIAAGRPNGSGLSERRSARVDRQIEEIRVDAPAALRKDLDMIGGVRRQALTGKGSALDAHTAYSKAISQLHGIVEDLVERMPARAGQGRFALADLDQAVEQAAAARGLLLAALAVPRETGTSTALDPVTGLPVQTNAGAPSANERTRNALTAAAQLAHVREQAGLADFDRSATSAARTSYRSTVSGPEVTAAEKYLAKLTDSPTLSSTELAYDRAKVEGALSARIEQMRGVESALAADRTDQLAQLRDDDVTALEIRIGLAALCLLVAVGISMGMARSLTRPLAVLRIGSARLAADPVAQEPVRYTGKGDEFAQVVDSVNALHAHLVGLHERLGGLESDRKHLIGQRQSMADERETLRAELAEAAARLEQVGQSINGTFVNLALRTLGLVERQLGVIEGLEDSETDPDRLGTLFKLDHLATVMRRHSENLLVLAGAEHGHGHPGPVPLVDVLRAAVSETERYERVKIASLPPHAHLAGFAADDISHLVAELMENATSFSPPDAQVEVSGWLLESGEVMLSVQDEGIGMTESRMTELNTRLSRMGTDGVYEQEGEGLGLGLYVVARLAARHGARVQLRSQNQGGITAVVVLPKSILAAAPALVAPPANAPVPGGAPALSLPGFEAEANSNVLRGRTLVKGGTTADEPLSRDSGSDPLIAAAEQAVGAAEPAPQSPGRTEPEAADSASPETTMELQAPPVPEIPTPRRPEYAEAADPSGPYAIGPDAHERTPDETEEPVPATVPAPTPEPQSETTAPERVTDKGLPKRTPKFTAPAAAPKPRSGSVDADKLRRRLGGFHSGAVAGRRDVEAEIAGAPANDGTGEAQGDSAEEARS